MFWEQQLGFFLLFSPPFMSREQLQRLCCQQQRERCQFLSISPQVTKWLEERKTKVEETRWGNNNFQSLWSPLFHLFCLDNPPLWVILYARTLMQRQFVIPSLLSERSSPQPTSAFCATSFWTHTRCNPYTLLSSEQYPVINKTNSNWGEQLRENHQFFKPLKLSISFPSQIVSFREPQAKSTSILKNIVMYSKFWSIIFWIT